MASAILRSGLIGRVGSISVADRLPRLSNLVSGSNSYNLFTSNGSALLRLIVCQSAKKAVTISFAGLFFSALVDSSVE